MLLLDIGIGCLFFAILMGGLSAFREFALSLQFGSNLFCLDRLFCIRRVAFYKKDMCSHYYMSVFIW